MSPLPSRLLVRGLVLLCCALGFAGSLVRADGLIYDLPPDGSWVRYDIRVSASARREGSKPMEFKLHGSLTLSSVGRVTSKDKICRWIELRHEVAPVAEPEQKITRILKLLIPEMYLKRGQDPFAHVLQMYYAESSSGRAELSVEKIEESETIDGKYGRQQYELDRFRSIFPAPLRKVSNEQQSLDTKLGRFDCEKLAGLSDLPPGPLRGGAEMAWKGEFETLLCEAVPFGVVGLRSKTRGYETTGGRKRKTELEADIILTIEKVGDKATSELSERH